MPCAFDAGMPMSLVVQACQQLNACLKRLSEKETAQDQVKLLIQDMLQDRQDVSSWEQRLGIRYLRQNQDTRREARF